MKKTMLLALAALAFPLFAVDLADFSNGFGRVILSGKPNFSAEIETEFLDDAVAPAPGKVLKVKLPAQNGKYGRFNAVVMISPEEAAAARTLSFDVRADNPASVAWISLYFFPRKQGPLHMIAPGGLWRGMKPGEWKHIEVPVGKFKVLGGEMSIEDARQVCLSFFCGGPVELQLANIKLLEK